MTSLGLWHAKQDWVRWDEYWDVETAIFCSVLVALFIMMITTLIILTYRLEKQARMLSTSVLMQKETCLLVTTHTLLGLSYLLRLAYYLVDKNDDAQHSFKTNMIAQTSSIPINIIPIMMLLYLHRRNL